MTDQFDPLGRPGGNVLQWDESKRKKCKITFVGISTARWYVEAEIQSNGDAATPFS